VTPERVEELVAEELGVLEVQEVTAGHS